MKKITIYTLPACPHCIALKKFLNEKKIEFENIDVESDEERAKEIINRTGGISCYRY